MAERRSLWDWCWRDPNGQVVLGQTPNAPLVVWLAATGLAWVLPDGRGADSATLVAFGALFTWAWLELFQGVNGFRRLIGLVVLVVIVLNRL